MHVASPVVLGVALPHRHHPPAPLPLAHVLPPPNHLVVAAHGGGGVVGDPRARFTWEKYMIVTVKILVRKKIVGDYFYLVLFNS